MKKNESTKELPLLGIVVNANSINLRDKPRGDVITSIPVDTSVTVIEVIGAWTFIKLDSGESGYVRTEYLSIKR